MPIVPLSQIQEKEIVPGYKARFVHSEHMTVAHWTVEAGAILPEHSHPHEQISQIISGEFELTLDETTQHLTSHEMAIIPPHTLHSGRAVTHCQIIDIFYPIREDYRKK